MSLTKKELTRLIDLYEVLIPRSIVRMCSLLVHYQLQQALGVYKYCTNIRFAWFPTVVSGFNKEKENVLFIKERSHNYLNLKIMYIHRIAWQPKHLFSDYIPRKTQTDLIYLLAETWTFDIILLKTSADFFFSFAFGYIPSVF